MSAERSQLGWGLAAAAALAAASAPPASAGASEAGRLTLLYENDLFANTDQQFTNGVFLRYETAPRPAGALGPLLAPGARTRLGFAASHAIYTPEDITNPDPSPDSRPYAGLALVSGALIATEPGRQDVWALEAGLVGPAAGGEEIQSFVHDRIVGEDPKGWDSQLENEPVFRLLYDQTRRVPLAEDLFGAGVEADALPRARASLGTLETSAGAGVALRVGDGLEGDFGAARALRGVAGADFGGGGAARWEAWVSADGLLVGRNLLLDGNTFRDSRSVDANPAVAQVSIGASASWGAATLGYAQIFRSPEFDGQSGWTSFGSVRLSMRF